MTKEENKVLIERMPYLMPRNVFTDKIVDNYDYEYIRGEYELPDGWFRLFLQMCEDIREPLKKADQLDSFRFSQIKEKWGMMECYNFGAPKVVHDIIDDYCYVSKFVCCCCGRPNTIRTTGWVESYCDNCHKGSTQDDYKKLEFDPTHVFTSYPCENDYKPITVERDCSNIWKRYLESGKI